MYFRFKRYLAPRCNWAGLEKAAERVIMQSGRAPLSVVKQIHPGEKEREKVRTED